MSISFISELPTPAEVKDLYSVSKAMGSLVAERRSQIGKIFRGETERLVLIVGPCSADVEESVLLYMERLAAVQEKVAAGSLLFLVFTHASLARRERGTRDFCISPIP